MTASTQLSLLEQHPLSAAFPSMPENEIAALAIDIETHGQREPGVTLDGMILDGWHRYLACHRLGVQFKAKEFDGADPVAFVISHNLHRRHLTASQRAGAVVAAHNWKPVGRPEINSAPGAGLSTKQLAEKAEVSERTIEHAKSAHGAGLGDKVRDGEVSAKRAAEVAKLPEGKREKAIKAIEDGKPTKAPKPRTEKGDVGKLQARIAELETSLAFEREAKSDLADTARELSDKLTVFESTEPDEQQKLIATLQKRIVRLEAEVDRVTVARNDANNKNNVLIREVKRLQKKQGAGQ